MLERRRASRAGAKGAEALPHRFSYGGSTCFLSRASCRRETRSTNRSRGPPMEISFQCARRSGFALFDNMWANRCFRERVAGNCGVSEFVICLVSHLQRRAGRTHRLPLPLSQGKFGWIDAVYRPILSAVSASEKLSHLRHESFMLRNCSNFSLPHESPGCAPARATVVNRCRLS